MNDFSHFLEEHLSAVVRCPLCRRKYNPLEARLITADDGAEFVHVECQRCRGAIIAKIALSREGTTSVVGIITDLSAQDLFRLRAREPMTTDDVLALARSFAHDHGASFVQALRAT